MEFALGKQALQSGASALNSELSKVNCGAFRKYFDVTDSNILSKLLLVIVPFYYKEDSLSSSLYKPEMYIPSMSIITLVLFKGFLLGLSNKFHPEILGMTFTRTIIIHLAVCLLYKVVCYFFDVSIDIKDLFCFVGYKFLIILFIKLFRLVMFGKLLSLYFLVAHFFFLSRSLKGSIISTNSPKTHLYLLFAIVGMDVLISFLMS
ncbi:uncharacterized protein VICG_01002 [Vittaforma corneae ATCC 50505]|uniref:Protein YIF1 n=1 Tax=Vittaforma corneae (strain ATCC 50505) TaxID=993615 RepID=L2GNA7_VITCO|nr:uncharacterized protein VICG_01002 [Vittaforma corneae ATCC 50505]ELA41985.1 hypothetical protein VICG_01002 [Vittaforma corneae ATCC 50505]